MRRSLTRMRYSDSGLAPPKNNLCSKDSPMCADNDAHNADGHSDPLEVGIADEVAYSKNVSRRRVVQSRRSIHHSIRLNELDNSPPSRNSLSSTLGKRRAKVFFKPENLEN